MFFVGSVVYTQSMLRRILIIGSFSIAIGALAFPKTNFVVSAEGLAGSRALYNANCASCHGRDGHSNTPKGRELDADNIAGGLSTAKTIRVVTNGRGDMPSFRKKLTAAQIASIASYVRTLK